MKVLITGSRSGKIETLQPYLPKETTMVLCGGAKGVDADAKRLAEEMQIEVVEFLPDYKRYGRGAPIVRNGQMLDEADFVLAFWNGTSRGTAYVIEQCRKRGIPLRIIRI